MIKYLMSAVILAGLALLQPAYADDHMRFHDVVEDERGGVVTSTSGDCVRTKWEVATDKCAKKEVSVPKRSGYMVFFDWDRYNLTQDAKGILANLAAKVKGKPTAAFQIVGHADRSGPDDYNMRLSKRRTESVVSELKRLGVKGNVQMLWKGESDPLVPTPDGIREPQNRRAEIKIVTR